MIKVILNANAKDRPGIVSELSGVIFSLNGNIAESKMLRFLISLVRRGRKEFKHSNIIESEKWRSGFKSSFADAIDAVPLNATTIVLLFLS